ncbi:MAG TPA: hypothetical protein PK691_04455 [Thermomicrobiales bacterium]|nr:hypothetical protein [Thermomicrobiales bacterium]
MARSETKTGNPSLGVFAVGVVVGGIGGGLAGWLLGGHLAPLLTSVLNLISRDSKQSPVRFEAMQQ